jgi:hypothetical protein
MSHADSTLHSTSRVTLWFLTVLLLAPAETRSFTSVHEEALRRARVWEEPATPIEEAKLDQTADGPGSFSVDEIVECTFKPGPVSGSTPKFNCALPNGDVVKIKYGRTNPEVYTEVAATRLLSALGFPTDRMYLVKTVRCAGCPVDPFSQTECAGKLPAGAASADCFPSPDYARSHDFDEAVIERPLEGRRLASKKARGWSWEELKFVDAVAGGATRAEIDALRLLAIFLGHWDNKGRNQRLICQGERKADDDCDRPLAMVQDLGATFGPLKLDLAGWSRTKIWADAPACKVSMRGLPYGGSTFPDAYISEDGRRFLGSRLGHLSTAQIRALFDGARFARYPHRRASARNVDNWVRAFQAKVRAIVDRAPCPDDPTPTATQRATTDPPRK